MPKALILMVAGIMVALVSLPVSAENYVNWKGGFWFTIPEGWEKVNYRIVDQYLAMTDTSRDVFDYEGVFAPSTSRPFAADAYLVVTFEATGTLTGAQADSILNGIAVSYADVVYDAPVVQLMSDLVPGKPKINRRERVVSVLSDMAFRPGAMKKLWQYMRLNDQGLISLFFYSPDSTYERNKPVFDEIVGSLSFENLKEAAQQEPLVFTEIGGDSVSSADSARSELADAEEVEAARGITNIKNILLFAVIIIVVFGLIWNFIIVPRLRKKRTSE